MSPVDYDLITVINVQNNNNNINNN